MPHRERFRRFPTYRPRRDEGDGGDAGQELGRKVGQFVRDVGAYPGYRQRPAGVAPERVGLAGRAERLLEQVATYPGYLQRPAGAPAPVGLAGTAQAFGGRVGAYPGFRQRPAGALAQAGFAGGFLGGLRGQPGQNQAFLPAVYGGGGQPYQYQTFLPAVYAPGAARQRPFPAQHPAYRGGAATAGTGARAPRRSYAPGVNPMEPTLIVGGPGSPYGFGFVGPGGAAGDRYTPAYQGGTGNLITIGGQTFALPAGSHPERPFGSGAVRGVFNTIPLDQATVYPEYGGEAGGGGGPFAFDFGGYGGGGGYTPEAPPPWYYGLVEWRFRNY